MNAVSRTIFSLQRILFALPFSATAKSVKRGLLAKFRQPAERSATPVEPHPFDRVYGTDTSGRASHDQLRSGKRSDVFNVGYAGSQPSVIRKALSQIPCPREATFVDLGCGKGRALVVASEFPFPRIIGVELSPLLAQVARANAAKVARRFPERSEIRIVEDDALSFEIPRGTTVIYMYNSFHRRVMKGVVERIRGVATGSKIFVVYYNPVHFDLLDGCPEFARFYVDKIAFDDAERAAAIFDNDQESVVIWQSIGPPMCAALPGADSTIVVTVPGFGAEVLK